MNRLFSLVLLTVSLLAVQVTAKESTKTFEVSTGVVKVTQARCPVKSCKPQIYHVKGSFAAITQNDLIQIPQSSLTATPDFEYALPTDPDLDEGGTQRKVSFVYRNGQMLLKGYEDKRAFDGPLIEYQISARLISDTADFDTLNFYTARPDFRKCAAPLCGGYFIKAVNMGLTRCADGKFRTECYVAEIKFGSAGLSGADAPLSLNPYLIQGQLTAKREGKSTVLGYFNATAAYVALVPETSTGLFVGLQNNGVVCVTSPCFSYDQLLLNSRRERQISHINFDSITNKKVDIDELWNSLGAGEVIIATGKNQQTQEMVGPGISFVVDNLYRPLKAK